MLMNLSYKTHIYISHKIKKILTLFILEAVNFYVDVHVWCQVNTMHL